MLAQPVSPPINEPLALVNANVINVRDGRMTANATIVMRDGRIESVIDLTDAGGDYDVPALRIRGQHMLPRLRDAIVRAHKAGVKIVTGSDTGYGPNSLTRIGQEVTHFVEMGFTPLEALQSATLVNAEMLRLEKSIGVVERGYEADLIATEKNPLENITTIQDPVLVISNGRIAVDRLNFARARTSSQ